MYINQRTDIYKRCLRSLGCVIYELVEREKAFSGGFGDIISNIRDKNMHPKVKTENSEFKDIIELYKYKLEFLLIKNSSHTYNKKNA